MLDDELAPDKTAGSAIKVLLKQATHTIMSNSSEL